MTRTRESSPGYRFQQYYVHAREGQSEDHVESLSCGNVVALGEQATAPLPATAVHLQQSALSVAKPDRSEAPAAAAVRAPPTAAGGGSLSSSPGDKSSTCCLDQYNSMRPDNPVQQLPLLGTTHTSSTARVAAWLLSQVDGAASAATGNDAVGADGDAGSLEAGGGSDTAALLAELERSASGSTPTLVPPIAEAAAAACDCSDMDGYRATDYCSDARRHSLDGFLSAPVKHGDALNNYVAALY